MLTEVMRYYGLARPPIDAGFYETDHHAQVLRDVRAAILGDRSTLNDLDVLERTQLRSTCRDQAQDSRPVIRVVIVKPDIHVDVHRTCDSVCVVPERSDQDSMTSVADGCAWVTSR
jgi:hypothetical protein